MTLDDKTMLALAALTYRGFGNHSEAAIHDALIGWLPKMESEGLGSWKLVWGPASFRARTSLIDDAMVFVAKQNDVPAPSPHRYAIAIRGTNPVSPFDWVFGDFWVSLQTDWDPLAQSSAKLSASTALGLAITQNLTFVSPPPKERVFERFGNAITSAFEHLASYFPKHDAPGSVFDIDRIVSIAQRAHDPNDPTRSQVVEEALSHFGALTNRLAHPAERILFDAIMHGIQNNHQAGQTLMDFLQHNVEEKAVVAVTGHSKGGALSVATALWLDETWASTRKAQIECFSFAGPTAGNAAFVERFNARLGSRTHRVVNRRDVVPQAFAPEKLRSLLEFYPLLKPAVDLVVSSVAPLGYTHVGGDLLEIESRQTSANPIQDLIYQHLDAYLSEASFQNKQDWNAEALFLGA
jgi:hypothetical protein